MARLGRSLPAPIVLLRTSLNVVLPYLTFSGAPGVGTFFLQPGIAAGFQGTQHSDAAFLVLTAAGLGVPPGSGHAALTLLSVQAPATSQSGTGSLGLLAKQSGLVGASASLTLLGTVQRPIPPLSFTGQVGVGRGAGGVFPWPGASGSVQAALGATTSLSLVAGAATIAKGGGFGSLTLSSSTATSTRDSAAGSLSLSGSVLAGQPAQALLSLIGNASFVTAGATGALALVGSGIGSTLATGLLSLLGTAAATINTQASAAVALLASATISPAGGGLGTFILVANPVSTGASGASGSITLGSSGLWSDAATAAFALQAASGISVTNVPTAALTLKAQTFASSLAPGLLVLSAAAIGAPLGVSTAAMSLATSGSQLPAGSLFAQITLGGSVLFFRAKASGAASVELTANPGEIIVIIVPRTMRAVAPVFTPYVTSGV